MPACGGAEAAPASCSAHALALSVVFQHFSLWSAERPTGLGLMPAARRVEGENNHQKATLLQAGRHRKGLPSTGQQQRGGEWRALADQVMVCSTVTLSSG